MLFFLFVCLIKMLNKLQERYIIFQLLVKGRKIKHIQYLNFLNLFIYAWLDLTRLVCDFLHTLLSCTFPLGRGENSQAKKPFRGNT